MKTLVIAKTTPTYVAKVLDDAIEMAYGFLCARYGWKFNNVVMVIQPTARRSRYFSNDRTPHKVYGKTPVATIACHSKLYLYEKKTLGQYRQGLNIGYLPNIACSMVHELTHHVQFMEGRPMGELETTHNEIDFLKSRFPEWHKLLMS